MRLFFAIALPDPVRITLAGFADNIAGIRWIPEANLHLTLRFIGNVDKETGDRICDAARAVSTERFDLELNRVGAFPSARNPRVLWIGADPSPPMITLYEKLDSCLKELRLDLDERPFSPHISIGRVRRGKRPDVDEWIEDHQRVGVPPVSVGAFHLFSSELQPQGAVYRILASYPLNESPTY